MEESLRDEHRLRVQSLVVGQDVYMLSGFDIAKGKVVDGQTGDGELMRFDNDGKSRSKFATWEPGRHPLRRAHG